MHKHTHALSQSVVFAETLAYMHCERAWALCDCELLSVALVPSLHAKGLVNYLPKRTESSGGKRRWGRRPCFWGNLEFATFTWVTIHSRSNSRLADVMFFFSSFLPSFFFLSLCLNHSGSPCTSHHFNYEKLELLKALVSACVCVFLVVTSEFWLRVCVCVCVALHLIQQIQRCGNRLLLWSRKKRCCFGVLG